MMKKFIVVICFLFAAFVMNAQATDTVEMADGLRASGKIYVVVAVLLIIFLGIVIYLINIDRKLMKLEKENQTK